MKGLPVALAAASIASGAAAQPRIEVDDAANRLVPLSAVAPVSAAQAETRSALHCTAARDFCLRAWRAGENGLWFLDLHDRLPPAPGGPPSRRLPLPAGEDPQGEIFEIWPHLVREASGALMIGVGRHRRVGFSGGGSGGTQLLLLRLATNAAASEEVLDAPTGYTALIRACFSEADYRRLGRACHQELEFAGTLTLEPAAAGGRPRFALTTVARVFPRGSLVEGWEYRRPRRTDLVWQRDPACSYRRHFAFDAASGRYAPDRPLPECSAYRLP